MASPVTAMIHSPLALEAARKIVDKVPPELSADKNVWALYATFLSRPMFVMVRFGMWEAMLLDAGRPNEAEVVYAADLKKNPNNGYALFGLKRALEEQGKIEDASATKKRFDRSWADATHKLSSSRS